MKRIYALLILGVFLSLACQSIGRLGRRAVPTQQVPVQQVPVTGQNLTASVHPSNRMWASLLYVPQVDKIVLFGGGRLTDTWSLDTTGVQWSMLKVKNAPNLMRLGGVTAAYDQRAERLIVFFYKGIDLPGETWSLNLSTGAWKNMRPENSPVSRRFTSLVYNSKADKTVLFGGAMGEDESTPTNELWEYDYQANRWTQKHPKDGPAPVYYHHTVYDPVADQLMVWGGKSAKPEKALWAYDDGKDAWTKTAYKEGPFSDYDGAMVFVAPENKVFLYVGDQFWSYDVKQRTWEALDGTGGPGRQYGGSLAYDPQHQSLVYFGGTGPQGNTWFYHLQTRNWTVLAAE